MGLGSSFFYILYFPYAQYQIFQIYGIDNHYLNVEKPAKNYLSPILKKPFWIEYNESRSLWKNTHFANYNLPMPVDHPGISFKPKPTIKNKVSIPSYSLTDFENKEIFKFIPQGTKKINFKVPNDIIFSIPIVENYILNMPRKKIIRDIFLKNIDIKIPMPHDIGGIISSYKKLSPLDLLYNIYLFKLRKRVFGSKFNELYIFNKSSVLINAGKEDGLTKYMLISFFRNKLYSTEIHIDKNNKQSLRAINHLAQNISVQPSRGVESAKKSYSLFRTLPFARRLTTRGISLLYSAWTHEMERKEYIRQLIYFLERGKNHQVYLIDIYSFSRHRWGSNFSTLKESRDESIEVENQRIREENQKSFDKRLLDDESDLEGTFKTDKEKLKFLLKKSKEKKRYYSDDIYSD